jgi:hypothetical protein
MTDTATSALIAAGTSLILALLSGGIALWNSRRTNAQSLEIQALKGAVDRNLEILKAKLSHGQIVSSTQWNAEFASYQAIWKGMVAVRTLANKIVLREGELVNLGLPGDYLASADRVEIRKKLIQKFLEASQGLLLAVHDNAPFYPAPIREAANDTHKSANDLLDKHLAALTHFLGNGEDVATGDQFTTESKALLLVIFEGVDRVESLIRDRLAAVEVVDRTRA